MQPTLPLSGEEGVDHRVKPGDDDHYESRCQHAATDFDEPDSREASPVMTIFGSSSRTGR
jgi:hypothetical protein